MKRFSIISPVLVAALMSSAACATDDARSPRPPEKTASQVRVESTEGMAYIPAGGAVFLNEHGYCRVVEVASDAPDVPKGASIVVPFKSPEEWRAFREHAPKGVTLTPCCPAMTVVDWPLSPTLLQSRANMKLGVEYFTDTGIRGGIYPQPKPFQCQAEGQGADATAHWTATGPAPTLPKPGEWKSLIYIPR